MASRDVFICHASVDKTSIVNPLEQQLAARGVSCWIDQAEIKVGDSIIEAIEDGIRLSQYVVVVVTEVFLQRAWTIREMRAALMREIRGGRVVLIPLLDVPKDRWDEAVPLQADKKVILWSDGPASVATKIAALFDRHPALEWAHNHPQPWVGPVWMRVVAPDLGAEEDIRLTLRWGPYVRHVTYTRIHDGPISLVHHKTKADSVTLHVECSRPAIVTFGTGIAPDPMPRAMVIDEGWTRAAGVAVSSPNAPSILPLPLDRHALAEILDES